MLRVEQARLARQPIERDHPGGALHRASGRFAVAEREKRGLGKPETFNFMGFPAIFVTCLLLTLPRRLA
jgi:hypothetical protein